MLGTLILSTLCGLSLASVLPGCAEAQVAEVPFEIANHHLVILGSIDQSRPIRMVLDTGMTPGVMLNNQEIAREIGLRAVRSASLGGAGAGGRLRAGVATNVRVDIGKVHFDRMNAIIIPSDSEYAKVTRDSTFEGVIGYSLFQNFVVCIDHEQNKLLLANPDKFQYGGQGHEVPFTLEATKPYVKAAARLDDDREIAVKMVVDTGATSALYLNPDTHPDLTVPDRNLDIVVGRGVSGKRRGRTARIPDFELAGYSFPNLLVSFPDAPIQGLAADRQGLIGNRLLNRFHSIFDYRRRRIILEPNQHFQEPFEFSMSGLMLYPNPTEEGLALVEEIIPDSPASQAGVQAGDLLVSVDGKPASDYSVFDLRDLFESNEGREFALEFVRAGERYDVKIRLRRLL